MDLKQSLAWESDNEAFSRAVRDNFGQFSEDRGKKLSVEQVRSPRLLVSEHGMNSKVRQWMQDQHNTLMLCHNSVRQSAPCDGFLSQDLYLT